MIDLKLFRKRINEKQTELSSVQRQLVSERKEYAEGEAHAANLAQAQQIAQAVAQTIQQQAHKQIAGVVSKCLELVFDSPYKFKINFEQKRGKTEASLLFERDGLEVDPLTASGGGVVDVAAFALRLSCLMLAKPPLRRILFLDEPFKFVSEDYRGNVKMMLEQLSKEMGIQLIMVTHIPELVTGKVIQL